jgi:hypothetical protein
MFAFFQRLTLASYTSGGSQKSIGLEVVSGGDHAVHSLGQTIIDEAKDGGRVSGSTSETLNHQAVLAMQSSQCNVLD